MTFDHLDDPGRLLDQLIRQRAAELGDKPFCEYGDGDVSYAAFDAQVDGVARGLLAAGLRRGEAVCVFMSNAPELLAFMFGVHRAGGIYVPCSPHSSVDEVAYQAGHVGAGVIVVDTGTLEAGRSVAAEHAVRTVVYVGDASPEGVLGYDAFLRAGAVGAVPLPVLHADDVCTVMYTSGTTSRPKGVMLTHGNHATAASNLVAAFGWHHSDRFLHFFPMYHANGGMVTVFPALLAGATLVMVDRFSASRFAEQLVEHRITFTTVNSTNCRILLSRPPSPSEQAHQVQRMVVGLTLDPADTERFEERYATRLCQCYGLTEGNCISLAVPPFSARRPGSSGSVLRGYQARVVDERGEEAEPGVDGELWIHAVERHGLALGYLDAPELTASTFVDGWLRTGDRGHFDDTGTFWYSGRATEMIKRSGYNISPAEIERVVTSVSGVRAAAAVSTPDPVYDESIVVFVEREDGATIGEGQVLEVCGRDLAAYKVPQRVVFVSTLPATFVGKLDRSDLRRRAASLMEGEGSDD